MKKNSCVKGRAMLSRRWKIFMIMKLQIVFILGFLIQSYAIVSHAQTKRLSLQFENNSLKEVFQTLEEQTDFSFIYKDELIESENKISGGFKDKLVTEILDNVLQDGDLTYAIKGRAIVILSRNSANVQGQQKVSVSGKVTDSSDAPLPGVSIVVKGTTDGTISDFQGKYLLANVPADGTLMFSFVGMKTQEIPVGGKTTIDVVLREQSIGIEEVIAVGYGTVKKSDITGSISSLKGNEMMKGSPVSFEQGMQGKLAGVNITKNDGSPGGGITMQIRGTNSFIGSAEPLYVIDGIPLATSSSQETINFDTDKDVTSRNALSFLSPDDIESIEVLKDASFHRNIRLVRSQWCGYDYNKNRKGRKRQN